ncbi:MAG: helix-turn-helix transcriptional regulator [bacterium]|nr:helix-turn-helix transcriptional regulator [bacterium]
MHKSFGAHLRAERKKQSLTAEKFAKMCGTSRSHITLIENDKRLPGKKIIPRIASALHLKTVVVLNWYLETISQKMQKALKIS